MKKRGQAALEFLMTYGWAIMVVLIAIATLAYFGVLSPDKFVPEKCVLEPGIACADFKTDENSVTLVLRNGKGEGITITSIKVQGCTGTASGVLRNGEQDTFIVDGCNNIANEKLRTQVNITYSGESSLTHTKTGTIVNKVVGGTTLVPVSWYDTQWQFRKIITIDQTKVDADFTNFPVLISLTDADLRDDAQNDGEDILFTSSDGTTKLSHEIEKFDGSTGELVAWVKVPSLSSTTDTGFYIYYGNLDASDQQDRENVWDSTYVVVQHMNEDPSGTPPQLLDSTSNSNDGTAHGTMTSGDLVSDGIGLAWDFDGNDYATMSLGALNAPYTVEVWGYFNNLNQPNGNYDYFMMLGHASAPSACSISREKGDGANANKFYNWDGSAQRFGPVLQGQQWLYIVLQMTTSSPYSTLYVDGSSESLDASLSQRDSDGDFIIGRYDPGTTHYLDGKISEVRVSNGLRSTDWIATEYNNQNDPSTFYSVGSEETQT